MTTETTAENNAAETPADERPDYAKTPVRDGYRRVWYDVPKTAPEPKPQAERIWSYVGAEATKFDNYAAELYSAGWRLAVEAVQRRRGRVDNDTGVDIPADLELARALNDQALAYQVALGSLIEAAQALRVARLALAPYVDADTVERGY